MEKMTNQMIETDCEGKADGYRCWAAGEQGFTEAVVNRIEPVVRESVRIEIAHLIDIETKVHARHHEYITSQIESNARDAERWEKIKTQVLGWGAITLVGWLGTLILKAFERGQP